MKPVLKATFNHAIDALAWFAAELPFLLLVVVALVLISVAIG